MSYDRYTRFRADGKIGKVPTVKLAEKSTDYFIMYRNGQSRLDNLSYEYYGDAGYDWLILMANPEYDLEYNIPDGTIIRIPYPLDVTLDDYNYKIDRYNALYGA